ncbi:MAG: hypothetical protein WD055_03875 [Candidatus Dependentiae bacterium]
MHQKLFLIVTIFSATSLLSVNFDNPNDKKRRIGTLVAPMTAILRHRKRNSQDYLTPPVEIGGVSIQTEKI